MGLQTTTSFVVCLIVSLGPVSPKSISSVDESVELLLPRSKRQVLSDSDIADIRGVFDLYDSWDGAKDGFISGAKIVDLLRQQSNPDNEQTLSYFDTEHFKHRFGEQRFSFDQILPIYQAITENTDTGTFADFMEAIKTYDRDGQGFISQAEMRDVLSSIGESLSDQDIENILQSTDTSEDLDQNIKYELFIKAVMAGAMTK